MELICIFIAGSLETAHWSITNLPILLAYENDRVPTKCVR